MFLYILQAGIDRRVFINAVDINGRFQINAATNDILKIKNVDGSTLYDSLELSFNAVDKSSSLKVSDIDILASLNLKALASDVYNKTDIDIVLNLKSYKINTYLKSDVDVLLSIL